MVGFETMPRNDPGSQMPLWRGSCHFDSLLERMKGNESETQTERMKDKRSVTLQLMVKLINIQEEKKAFLTCFLFTAHWIGNWLLNNSNVDQSLCK